MFCKRRMKDSPFRSTFWKLLFEFCTFFWQMLKMTCLFLKLKNPKETIFWKFLKNMLFLDMYSFLHSMTLNFLTKKCSSNNVERKMWMIGKICCSFFKSVLIFFLSELYNQAILWEKICRKIHGNNWDRLWSNKVSQILNRIQQNIQLLVMPQAWFQRYRSALGTDALAQCPN